MNRSTHYHPIKLIWYNLEFKYGRWIKCALLLLVLIAYALFGGLLVHQFEAPAERELNAQLDQVTLLLVSFVAFSLLLNPYYHLSFTGNHRAP